MPQTRFDFTGRRALVTGATGGIGREVVRLLLDSGASVVAQDLSPQALAGLAAEMEHHGETLRTLAGDASSEETIRAAVAMAADGGTVDMVLPIAGIYPEATVIETADETWNAVQRINLEAVFRLTRAALPAMSDGGSITAFASVAGHRGSEKHAAYAASKAGVIALVRSLAHEAGPLGIRVNALSPGTIATPMVDSLVAERGDAMLAATPLRRFGRPEEVASAAVFLCSDAASFITGQAIHVNGGLFMAG